MIQARPLLAALPNPLTEFLSIAHLVKVGNNIDQIQLVSVFPFGAPQP